MMGRKEFLGTLRSLYSHSTRGLTWGRKSTTYWNGETVLRGALVGGGGSLGIYYYYYNIHHKGKEGAPHHLLAKSIENERKKDDFFSSAGMRRPDLPTYALREVEKHTDPSTGRVWVTFKEGVYDITEFIPKHPGGEQLLLAAGSSIEPFWNLYGIHKDNSTVYELLEKYRIGNLNSSEVFNILDEDDPFSTDPKRHPVLRSFTTKPFNAEPPLSILADSYLTPNEVFYVRNHLPVPVIDEKSYELEIESVVQGAPSITLSLKDLKTKFPKYTLTAAVQCGGNRRVEMNEKKQLKGISWKGAAIGNAKWSGVRLRDVLEYYGIKDNEETEKKFKGYHVQFEGYDVGADGNPFGASIPLSRALDPRKDVLLAYEMNDEELPRDHGYPIRVIAPGTVGVRNVKWLSRIYISNEESDSHFQRRDYKNFNPSVTWDNVDFSKSSAIMDMPVTSSICKPSRGEEIILKSEESTFLAKGYAWSGAGSKVMRVDVTVDGGKTWFEGNITKTDEEAKEGRHYGWILWEAEIPVKKGQKELEIWCKAVDSNQNVQPESFENIWNLRGMASSAYPRVNVKISRK